jgi:uncharacterized protein involved in response to NO
MTNTHWLSGGFRPFFLLGALAMAGSVLAWIPVYAGGLEIPTAFAPRDWHVHTMLFGGVLAIVAGFALTAVANWTGRPPVAGVRLLGLVVLWLAGRAAVSTSALIGPVPAAVADLAFPVALVAVFAGEVIAAGNLRNLRVVAVVAALGVADLCFHVEAATAGGADVAIRAAVSLVLLLVMLIGGRIVPAFTRNWLAARKAARLPAAFSRLDGASIAAAALALAAWTAVPHHLATAAVLAVAGALAAVRMSRWCGWAVRSEPLLLVLHVAFATIPLGFAAVALSIVVPDIVDPVAATHVWTVGTVGSITLAVMTRASRGHSGRPLAAGPLEVAMFALVLAGAAARVAAPYADGWAFHALEAAGLAWAAAYLLFAAGYARMLLLRPRLP